MATWTNADGLTLKYGVDRAEDGIQGEYRTAGPKRCIELEFDYTQLPTVAQNSVVIGDNLRLPIGIFVEEVEIRAWTDFDSSGDTMTLNVGWVDLDGTSNVDVDAFVVAATQTELNTGGTNVAGWVGAEVGTGTTVTTVPKLITWEVDSQAATAGRGVIRIWYSVP